MLYFVKKHAVAYKLSGLKIFHAKLRSILPGLVLDCFCSVVPHTEYVIDMS